MSELAPESSGSFADPVTQGEDQPIADLASTTPATPYTLEDYITDAINDAAKDMNRTN